MKEFKAVRPGWAAGKTAQSGLVQPTAPRPEAAMQTDAPVRKTGRLSREDQRRLSDILQRVYVDVARQRVPDRFKNLLSQLDGRTHKSETEVHSSRGNEQSSDEEAPERVVGGRGLESP